ncbi:MAG: AI-2E family transporter [Patescibacteria group bacterium]
MPEIKDNVIAISLGTITKAIVVILLFLTLYLLKDLVLVLLMSIVIASAIEPGTQWFVKRKIPRLFAVILIYLLIAMFLVGAVFFLLIPLLSESSDFLRNFPAYMSAKEGVETVSTTGLVGESITGIANTFNFDDVIHGINTVMAGIYSNTFGSLATFFGGVLSFILTIILSFYLAVEEDGVAKFLKAITTIKHENYIVSLWKRSQKKIGLWMQGQLVLAVIIGMLVYLGLTLLSVPNALLLAVLAAIFEIIPLFGPILASIPAILIAFVSGGLPMAVIVMGLYLIVHQFENQLIYPLVVKKVVGVSPVVSIVALAAGWELVGFIGLILAVPISAVILEFFNDFEKDKIEKMEKMLNS